MNKPTKFSELLDYLRSHPHFHATSDNPNHPPEVMTFDDYIHGLLYFRSADGRRRHFPINCGMTEAETGVTFEDDAFTIEKFGIKIRCAYLPDAQESVADGQDSQAQ